MRLAALFGVVLVTVSVLASTSTVVGIAGAANQSLTACTTIESSGTYQLSGDISNKTSPACIQVNASDVTVDGQGHTIDKEGSGEAVNVSASGSISNVTIENLEVRDASTAIGAHVPADDSLSDVTIRNVTMREFDSGTVGIEAQVFENGSLEDVEIGDSEVFGYEFGSKPEGIHVVANRSDTTVADLRVRNSTIGRNQSIETSTGIQIDSTASSKASARGSAVTGLAVTDTEINAEDEGVRIGIEGAEVDTNQDGPVRDVFLARNNISQTGDEGIYFEMDDDSYRGPLSNVTIRNNTFVENGDDAISIDADEEDMRVDNLTITDNTANRTGGNVLNLEFDGDGAVVETIDIDHNEIVEPARDAIDIEVDGDFARLESLDIDDNEISEAADVGLRIDGEGESTTLDGINVTGNDINISQSFTVEGIEIAAGGDGTSLNTSITDNSINATDDSLRFDLEGDSGPKRDSYDIDITDNEITVGQTSGFGDYYGIYLDPRNNNTRLDLTVTDNLIDSESDALGVDTTPDYPAGNNQTLIFDVRRNELNASYDGIDVDGDGDRTSFSANVTNNDVNATDGVHIDAAADNGSAELVVVDNTINASSDGLEFDADDQNQTVEASITDNTFEGEEELDAVDMDAGDDNVTADFTVTDNTFDGIDDWLEVEVDFGENITSDIEVSDNYVNATDDGIEIDAEGENSTTDIAIVDNNISVGDDFIDDIDVDEYNQTSAIDIRRNDVNASGDGVEIDADDNQATTDISLVANTFERVEEGMELDISSFGNNVTADLDISDNVLNATDDMLQVVGDGNDVSLDLSVDNNTLDGPSSFQNVSVTGIDLELASTNGTVDAAVTDNTITNATRGIEHELDGFNQTVDLLVENNEITDFESGIAFYDIQLLDAHRVDALVRSNLLTSQSSTGIEIGTSNGTASTADALRIERNRIDMAGGDAIYVTGPVAGIEIHRNELLTAGFGVFNANTTAGTYVNATNNFWGASDGPGSLGPYSDPVTGALANGSGSAVTEGETTNVSNVRFDPFRTSGSGKPRAVLTANRTSTVPGGPPVEFDARGSGDLDGRIVQYRFDFDGDGSDERTTAEPLVVHQYTTAGTFDAQVTVVDDDGRSSTDTATVTVRASADGDLEVSPTTADVNVTTVSFNVTDISGSATPTRFEWDFDGDGDTDATTSDNETTHVYESLLGSIRPSVSVFDSQGLLFTAGADLTVDDRIDPVVAASAPAEVSEGETFTVDASASSDNDQIETFTFETDEGTTTTTSLDTADLSLSTAGEHTITVEATDRSGNTDSTTLQVNASSPPDIVAEVDENATTVLDDGRVVANVSVRNAGDRTSSFDLDLTVGEGSVYWQYRVNAETYTKRVRDLAPGENETVTFDLSTWTGDHFESSRPEVALTATADPTDEVAEIDETNNRASAQTEIRFSDIETQVYVDRRSVTISSEEVTLIFENDGNTASDSHNATLDFGDGTKQSIQIPELDAGERNTTTVDHTFDPGTHEVNVTVTDDPLEDGNIATDLTETENYSLTLAGIGLPSTIERGETFYVEVRSSENVDSNKEYTIDLPDGLELTSGQSRTQTTSSRVSSWEVRANESGDFEINASVSARSLTKNDSSTMEVVPPKIEITDTASAVPNSTVTTSIEVRPEETFEHTLTIDAQLGPTGRTLSGLQYLFTYPHGCVEQTTSPMLAAMNTDQYYRSDGATTPSSYDQSRTDDAVAGGLGSLATGSNAQHDNGAWSMWGSNPDGDMYYTAYALYGASEISNDPRYSSRNADELNAVDFNETVFWLEDNQESDGRLANDKSYFEDDYAMTGFTLVALDRAEPYNASADAAAGRVRQDAAQFLADTQNDDGSWGDGESNGMSTALAVWGLAESDVSSDSVEQAMDDGVAWLIENQASDGAWTEQRSSSWRPTGTTSETTAYSLLALNATGIPAGNATMQNGVRYLVQTYDEGGSFGYTRASAIAIEALLVLDQPGASTPDRSVNVTLETGGTTINKSIRVNDSNQQVLLELNNTELQMLRDDTTASDPVVDVIVDSTGDGTVIVGLENVQVVNEDEYESNTGGT